LLKRSVKLMSMIVEGELCSVLTMPSKKGGYVSGVTRREQGYRGQSSGGMIW